MEAVGIFKQKTFLNFSQLSFFSPKNDLFAFQIWAKLRFFGNKIKKTEPK
jgi:hypothetical protein